MPANPLPGRALLSYALHYAALGWPVLPLHTIRPDGRCSCGEVSCRTPGKHPRTARGQDEASSDPEVIRRWWQRWPAANIGVRADLAGLAVIDIDPRNGGSVEALPEPLDTLAARTGGGGWHLFVKAPELAAFPSKLATGIDIKHHGYVVVEPSMHASGERYAFIDWEVGDPLPRVADAPLWLLRPQGMDAAPPEPDAGILEALTAEQLADLEATLRTIPSDDRGTWVAVGHALRTVADHGFRLWDAWSQGSAKYDAADARRVWESFKPRTTHWKWVLKHAEELGGRNVHQATTPTAAGGRAAHVTSSVDGWAFADFATLESDPPPARRWIVRDWIPACSVTALFGSGGIGKSLVAQQIATHVALNEAVFGIDVEPGPALVMSCEDDQDELRRRQAAIQRRHGAPIGDAPIFATGLAGEDCMLVTFDREQRLQYTAVWGRLVAAVERLRPVLLVVDNIAHVFGGLENDRRHVTAFVSALTGLARRFELAVLLIGHVAKLEGSEYSGSTAWEAAVRTRLWLERKDDGTVVLHRRKANYASRDAIALEWADGAFAPVAPKDRRAAGQAAERTVLAGLSTLTARQIATSHSPASAQSYLPRVLQREGLLNGLSVEAAARALGSLIDAGSIEPNAQLSWKKPDRHWAMGLRLRALV